MGEKGKDKGIWPMVEVRLFGKERNRRGSPHKQMNFLSRRRIFDAVEARLSSSPL
jgi:hypothetical protein